MSAAMKKYWFTILAFVTCLDFPGSIAAEDWGRFRGPNGSGVSSSEKITTDFSTDANVLWKVEAGKGTSCPIIVGGKLFLTSVNGDERIIKCLDAKSGNSLWAKSVTKIRDENATPPNNPATCTPVSNGEYVVVHFPDAGIFAYDLAGELKWQKDIGPFYSMHGISSSPAIIGDKVVFSIDHLRDPFTVALDLKTGNEAWRSERLVGVTGGYSSPGEMTIDGKLVVVSIAPSELVLYDLETGKKLLSSIGVANAPIAVPVIVGDRIFYSEAPFEPIPMTALGNVDKDNDGVVVLDDVKKAVGVFRLLERVDKGFGNDDGKVDTKEWDKAFATFTDGGGLSCLQVKTDGAEWSIEKSWRQYKSIPYIPSLVIVDGLLYTIDDGGVLSSYDIASGDLVKRERLGQATGQYYASPIAAAGTVVLANNDGKVSLVQAGKDWKLLNTVDLEEPISATPAISNGILYIRTESHLYAFGS
jgi:outer membrane protein assembly factor BamB